MIEVKSIKALADRLQAFNKDLNDVTIVYYDDADSK